MNRMIRAAAAAAILTAGLGSVGCVHTGGCSTGGCDGAAGGRGARGEGHSALGDCYRNAIDPCYPERYNFAARQAVIYPFAQQVHNGHVLNQTIWNYYFEVDPVTKEPTRLTPAGMEKLDSLARTRPAPDPKIYIQTARDLPPNVDPVRVPDVRADIDTKRAAVILKYLSTQPAFAPVTYEVYVHDAPTPGINADMASNAYRSSLQGYRGGISGAAGIGALGTGGSTNLTVAPVINNSGGPRP